MELKFTDIAETKDGSYLVARNVIQDRWRGLIEQKNRIGVLLKISKYGHVIWSKKFESAPGLNNSGYNLSLTNVIETASGDLIAYLASDYENNYQAYGKIVCLDKNGKLKWNTLQATNDYNGGPPSLRTKRALLQLRNGFIVVGDIIYKSDRSSGALITKSSQLHFSRWM